MTTEGGASGAATAPAADVLTSTIAPVITLLTDFGTADGFVAAVRGVLLSRGYRGPVVDVTHDIPSQDIAAAAYVLSTTYAAFPPGTVHLAVVDPGVGSSRRPIAAHADGHLFIAPDNGILTRVLKDTADARVHEIARGDLFRHPVSQTFHARDVFAPMAAALALGLPLDAVGPPITDAVRMAIEEPRVVGREVVGTVVHVDRFGNLITDLTPELLRSAFGEAAFAVEVEGAAVVRVVTAYAEAPVGAPVALRGSAGRLEISVREGSAADRMGVGRGASVRARRV